MQPWACPSALCSRHQPPWLAVSSCPCLGPMLVTTCVYGTLLLETAGDQGVKCQSGVCNSANCLPSSKWPKMSWPDLCHSCLGDAGRVKLTMVAKPLLLTVLQDPPLQGKGTSHISFSTHLHKLSVVLGTRLFLLS